MIRKLIILVLFFSFVALGSCKKKPIEKSLDVFYNYKGEAMDPLIIAGVDIVPLVIEKIKDKNMKKRTFAMLFLGNGSYNKGLPVLREIIEDQNDPDREVALFAIYQINAEIGKEYAKIHQLRSDKLGKISRDILQDEEYLKQRRTYFQAFLSYSDEKYVETP
jgi:hypothetical protein